MASDVKWWTEHGRMKEAVDVAKVVDTSFTDYAVKQLGRYR
jgi:hypothetical protein